jgi:hypothetical protein
LDLQQTGGPHASPGVDLRFTPRSGPDASLQGAASPLAARGGRGNATATDLVVPTTRLGVAAASRPHGGDLLDHIKNLKIKRYIDIWYVTYRNLHFFERPDEGGLLGARSVPTSTATAPPLGAATPPSRGDDVAALRVPLVPREAGDQAGSPSIGGGPDASMASRNS